MCREQLPVWQKFYEAHRQSKFEVLGVAMDAQGPEVVRRFTEAAGVTFPAAVDRSQGLWQLYGFDVVPNGFFVDERGILQYAKIGGFEGRNREDAQAIEELVAAPMEEPFTTTAATHFATREEALQQAEEAAQKNPENLDARLTLAERLLEARRYTEARRHFEAVAEENPKATRALLGLAAIFLDLGDREKAASALMKARAIEPDNWIIRKQIWAVEHPEQFYPAINPNWQRQQLEKEKAAAK